MVRGRASTRARLATLRLLPLLLLAALLCACGFFSSSLFPGYLAQAEASFDVGPAIDDFLSGQDLPWHGEVFVLRDSLGRDYGAVRIEIDSLPDSLLLLAGPQGELQQLSSRKLGRLHLADLSGNFVVGSMAFAPDDLPGATPIAAIASEAYKLGFAASSSNYLLWTDSADSSMLQSAAHNAAWAAGVVLTAQIDYSAGYELRGVFYDPAAAGREVILVFFNYNSSQVVVLFTPQSGYASGFATPPTLLEQCAHVEVQDVDANRVMYTRKGLVVADWKGRSILYDFNLVDTGQGLDLGQAAEVQIGFNLEGDTFFAFNAEKRMLYRGRTGW